MMRTYDNILCECGHQGRILCKENDAPFSSLWESYSLEGFEGGTVTITNYKDMPQDLIAALKPKCPKCGQTGKASYIKAT